MGSGSNGWRMYNAAAVPLWRTVGDMPPSRKSPTTRASLACNASTKLCVDHATPILASSLRGSLLVSLVGASLLASLVSGSSLGIGCGDVDRVTRSEEHTSELQSHSDLVCRLLLEKKK